jgi:hypothetical protein
MMVSIGAFLFYFGHRTVWKIPVVSSRDYTSKHFGMIDSRADNLFGLHFLLSPGPNGIARCGLATNVSFSSSEAYVKGSKAVQACALPILDARRYFYALISAHFLRRCT